MTAPASPFATSTQVALLFPHFAPEGEFIDGSTTPSATTVETYLTWINGQILRRFQDAGYIIPLAEVDGEDWPEAQTEYLQMLTILGVAGLISGPSVMNLTNPGQTKNIFKQEYDAELNSIFNVQNLKTGIRFRAQTYAGTAAERKQSQPQGPSTNVTAGYEDPGAHVSFVDMTAKVRKMQGYFEDLNLNWNYIYGLYSIGRYV